MRNPLRRMRVRDWVFAAVVAAFFGWLAYTTLWSGR